MDRGKLPAWKPGAFRLFGASAVFALPAFVLLDS